MTLFLLLIILSSIFASLSSGARDGQIGRFAPLPLSRPRRPVDSSRSCTSRLNTDPDRPFLISNSSTEKAQFGDTEPIFLNIWPILQQNCHSKFEGFHHLNTACFKGWSGAAVAAQCLLRFSFRACLFSRVNVHLPLCGERPDRRKCVNAGEEHQRQEQKRSIDRARGYKQAPRRGHGSDEDRASSCTSKRCTWLLKVIVTCHGRRRRHTCRRHRRSRDTP